MVNFQGQNGAVATFYLKISAGEGKTFYGILNFKTILTMVSKSFLMIGFNLCWNSVSCDQGWLTIPGVTSHGWLTIRWWEYLELTTRPCAHVIFLMIFFLENNDHVVSHMLPSKMGDISSNLFENKLRKRHRVADRKLISFYLLICNTM